MGSDHGREAGEPGVRTSAGEASMDRAADSGSGRGPGQVPPASCAAARYAIRVQGHLDADWSDWLDGMTLTHEEGGVTRLEGPVKDQSALYGLLNKLRDLSLLLISVQRR